MALHEIHHHGFHGHTALRFRGSAEVVRYKSGLTLTRVEVSRRVAKRLNDAVCGMSDCKCGESVAYPDWDDVNDQDSARWYVNIA